MQRAENAIIQFVRGGKLQEIVGVLDDLKWTTELVGRDLNSVEWRQMKIQFVLEGV